MRSRRGVLKGLDISPCIGLLFGPVFWEAPEGTRCPSSGLNPSCVFPTALDRGLLTEVRQGSLDGGHQVWVSEETAGDDFGSKTVPWCKPVAHRLL